MQRQFLLDEGIQFDENDCVDFERYGWNGTAEGNMPPEES